MENQQWLPGIQANVPPEPPSDLSSPPGFGASPASPPTLPAITGATYSQQSTDVALVFNGTASCTVTLLAPSSVPGEILHVKTVAAFTVVSASANVVPKVGGAASAAILPATVGAWAILISDGTNWNIMASGT